VLDRYDDALRIADTLSECCDRLGIDYVFKGSFDKANRSLLGSFRGPGYDFGLDMLSKIKGDVGCWVTTDFHSPAQIQSLKHPIDVVQIPALLSRQTDLLCAASESGRIVNLKKGQFMDHLSLRSALGKLEGSEVWVTDRGNCFGYSDVVLDFRHIGYVRDLGVRCLIDCSHTAWHRTNTPVLARAAIAAGADGVFIECAIDPENVKCDGTTSMYLDDMTKLLEQLGRISNALRN